MLKTRAKVLLAVGALLGASGVGLVLSAAPAAAAPITVGGCPTSSGSTDTATISVTIDDTLLATGNIVPLHDRSGKDGNFYNGVVFDPNAGDADMSSPVCGVQAAPGGGLRYHWLYCTEKPLNVCGNAPWVMGQSAAAATLTTLDKGRLAYVLDNLIDNSTAGTRAQSQRLVWCVTEHVGAGQPAPSYLGGEPALNCPNWTAIDASLNLNPQLSATATPAIAETGGTVTFGVTTNVSPLTVAPTGLDGLTVCAGQAGVTLAGGTLTIDGVGAGRTVNLCGVRAAAGNGSISVAFANPTVSTLQFWQRATDNGSCQGMLSTEIVPGPGVNAQAAAAWQSILDTTTTAATTTTTVVGGTTTTDPGTTTTTRPIEVLDTSTFPVVGVTLPRTGADRTTSTAWIGGLLVLAGGALVWAGRRRGAHD